MGKMIVKTEEEYKNELQKFQSKMTAQHKIIKDKEISTSEKRKVLIRCRIRISLISIWNGNDADIRKIITKI